MRSPKQFVSEMWANFDVSRSSWFGPSWSALRGLWADTSFFSRPVMKESSINYDLARMLYRNAHEEYRYGAGFVRPIIDLSVDYMGLPSVSGTPDDSFLNECIMDFWAPQLQQMFRDCMRDSKTVVRFRQPMATNPLFTEQDRMHGRLEIVPPEEADLTFDPSDPDLLTRAAFTHFISFDERTDEEVVQGTAPRLVVHEIVEVITPTEYNFHDKTSGEILSEWTTKNTWGFVPAWPVFNEYAADLGGGQSDLEAVEPFLKAFHEVLQDSLAAHKYHSIPKAFFSIKNVDQFIKNNWPEAIDEATGKPKSGAKINLSGREVYFFNVDEKGGFIEARSVLGDSKTLLEFLIECISVASETPRWALLAQNTALPTTDASVQPFVKKISRKRVQFNDAMVMICKMALKSANKMPNTPRVSWGVVQLTDLATKGQSLQQFVMAFDVAAQHQWMADRTIVQILGTLFDELADPDQEMKDAKNNVEVLAPAPAPASDTQGAQTGPSSSNGSGSKANAKKALATTSASNS